MKRFLAAAAVAPLCFAAFQAQAQTTITDARTAPVATSTTGNLTVSATGSITVTANAGVTLDAAGSTVSIDGAVDIKDATTPATGVLVTAPSGSVAQTGILNVTDTEVLKDNDGDGDLDGPFVSATTTRFGIRVVNPFTGSINQTGGQILIRGNNSAAISIDNGLTGNLTVRGSNVLVGANSFGVRVLGPVIGTIDIGGTLSAQGAASEGVSITGPVTGRVIFSGSVTATGYRYLTRALAFDLAKLDADDLLTGGPGARIGSSITGGLLINAVTSNTDVLDTDNNTATPDIVDPHPDEDGDGIPDLNETAASITSYGRAPGLLVASPGAISLGNVGTGKSAYGLVIKGVVVGNGLFDGFDATAVQIGGGGGTVATSGGVSVGASGTVFGTAVLGNARGMVFASGATAPTLKVDGQIQTSTTSSATVVPNAVAVQINPGATLASLTVNGTVASTVSGPTGVATAVLDSSGTLGQIINTGFIRAAQSQINLTDVLIGKTIALDLRANTAGVNITQTHNSLESITPGIIGDVLFGSGNASLTVLEGAVTGDLAFGSGVNSLTINGVKTTTNSTVTPNTTSTSVNGSVTGKLTNTGALSVAVLSGSLVNTNTSTVSLTSLNVGSAGALSFTLNPSGAAGSTGTSYAVSGATTLASGSKVDVAFGSKLINSQAFTLISSGSLTNAGLDTSLLGNTPFIYTSALTTTPTAVTLSVGRRSLAALGLSGSRAAAYEPVFAAFDSDAGVAKALLGKTNQASFTEFYNQLLPDYSGGAFHSLATATRAVMKAQGDEPAGMQTDQRRSWLQEVGFTTRNQGNAAGDIAYDSAGFGLAGGIESARRNGVVHGWSMAFASSDIDDDNRRGFSKLTASALLGSAYWRAEPISKLLLNASVTGGFAWFDSDRQVLDEDSTGARILQRQAGGKWTGALGAARLSATYNIDLGRFYIRPDASLDYVYLAEGGYKEHGGGVAVDLAVNSRTSYEAAAEAGVTFGGHFGRVFKWDPELRIAYRSNLSEGLSDTTARFLAGGNPFLMRALGVDQNRLVVRAAIRGGSRYASVALEGTGDLGDVYTAYEGRLVVRFIF